MSDGPLYLGFDLSTQQLKGLVVDSSLKKIHEAKFDFDADAKGFNVNKGILVNEAEHEVFAPVTMWLQAIDTLLTRLKDNGLDFSRIKGISGSGMQHGSVFWNADAEQILARLDPNKTLEAQLEGAFAHPFSPNWQDASTQKECDEFDAILGSEAQLAAATGSKAHHRFTGPQILRFQRKYPDKYSKTVRITLVSSWLATVFLGKFAPFDISDVCGMNLWDLKAGKWNEKLLELTAGSSGVETLRSKLGDVPEDGGCNLGSISSYFVQRHGFSQDCTIVVSTGDNPSTILALPLRNNDAMVSLGTSTTFLMSTSEYKPDPATHFFNSPTTAGLYMFMLCYKNGGLAREEVRNAINSTVSLSDKNSWDEFDKHLLLTPPLAQEDLSKPMHLGLYFPRPEIIPNLPVGEWHFSYDVQTDTLTRTDSVPGTPQADARLIVESQFLSLRLRSRELVSSPAPDLPPQPRRIYLVGGGSRNRAIARVAGQVLGGSDGVFKLDVGENACALGAAYKAVWAIEREESKNETFEELIGKRWREDDFVEKIADGYDEKVFHRYGQALVGFERMEQVLLREQAEQAK
ncbi:D-xylulose kinase A [Exophiala aquamarina CBS 119918]|uniref:Xylulose kinase n=1 Tax=Exophiala aquamarina CBS 119918 TaxID=1182545 RepID=A0A072PLD7_9EURO|nr:D-xylulose kinase A [Exophiala aquamarina CBS 119918]KEF60158.1 D-xylulose kinase A [Exophiala aquamarina CBS 119918]